VGDISKRFGTARKETLPPHPITWQGTCHCAPKAWQSHPEIAELVPSRSSKPFAPLVILTLNEVKGKNLTAQDRLREEASEESLPVCFGCASQPHALLAVTSNETTCHQSPERVQLIAFYHLISYTYQNKSADGFSLRVTAF